LLLLLLLLQIVPTVEEYLKRCVLTRQLRVGLVVPVPVAPAVPTRSRSQTT
jgi:hypothetical protein